METFMAATEIIKNIVWSNILIVLLMGAWVRASIFLFGLDFRNSAFSRKCSGC